MNPAMESIVRTRTDKLVHSRTAGMDQGLAEEERVTNGPSLGVVDLETQLHTANRGSELVDMASIMGHLASYGMAAVILWCIVSFPNPHPLPFVIAGRRPGRPFINNEWRPGRSKSREDRIIPTGTVGIELDTDIFQDPKVFEPCK